MEIENTFESFAEHLRQDLTNARSVVDMENYKASMLQEMRVLHLQDAVQRKCLHFLLTQNDQPNIFSEPKYDAYRNLIGGKC